MFWVYHRRFPRSILAVSLCLIGTLNSCQCGPAQHEIESKGVGVYQKVTGDDLDSDRNRWDQVYDSEGYVFGKDPAELLTEYVEILPVGRALDIAMGEGRNAVFLAKKGFVVEGVDLSEVAIRKAKRLARENKVDIQTLNADLNSYQIRPESYEVILNIQYLQRSLIPQIRKGLKRGGVVVFENQTIDQLKLAGSEGVRRDFLLNRGELKEAFKDFKILHYREFTRGNQALAQLVAMKP